MAQVGHNDPKVTLGIYAQVTPRRTIMVLHSTVWSAISTPRRGTSPRQRPVTRSTFEGQRFSK